MNVFFKLIVLQDRPYFLLFWDLTLQIILWRCAKIWTFMPSYCSSDFFVLWILPPICFWIWNNKFIWELHHLFQLIWGKQKNKNKQTNKQTIMNLCSKCRFSESIFFCYSLYSLNIYQQENRLFHRHSVWHWYIACGNFSTLLLGEWSFIN